MAEIPAQPASNRLAAVPQGNQIELTPSFLKALPVLKRALLTSNAVPILSNVLIEATENTLSATVTNLEVFATYWELRAPGAAARVTVPFLQLLDALKGSQSATLVTGVREDRASLHTDRALRILVTMPAEDFPPGNRAITRSFRLKLTEADIHEIVRVSVFAANEPYRGQALTGTLIEGRDKLTRFTATDGYRLCVAERQIVGRDVRLILPAALTHVLAGIKTKDLTAGQLVVGPLWSALTVGAFTFRFRNVDGQYPNYEQVLPATFNKDTFANRKDLLHAVEAASAVAGDRANFIRLVLGTGRIVVKAQSDEAGAFEAEISARTVDELDIAFNGKYLRECLRTFKSDEIKLSFVGPLSPGRIEDPAHPETFAILMPLRQ